MAHFRVLRKEPGRHVALTNTAQDEVRRDSLHVGRHAADRSALAHFARGRLVLLSRMEDPHGVGRGRRAVMVHHHALSCHRQRVVSRRRTGDSEIESHFDRVAWAL